MKSFIPPFIHRLPEPTGPIVQTLAYALAAGLGSVGFLWTTHHLFDLLFTRHQNSAPTEFLLWSLSAIVLSSLLAGLLLWRFGREEAGSGIPQLKVAYWKNMGVVPRHSVWVKFLAGALTIGGGASLGREGPSVFIGGGLGAQVAGRLGQPRSACRAALSIGGAAALAAAFNTPLAGITFVLEEIIGNLNSRILGRVVLASVVGAFTVHALIGSQPAFNVPTILRPTWTVYVILPLVAATAAAVGVLFQKMTLHRRERIRTQSRLPIWMRPLCGALITWILGAAVFLATRRIGVFGLGYGDLSAALAANLEWKVAALLVLAKLLATESAYGWGGCGGIFAPTLFMGGLIGVCLGQWAQCWIPLSPSDITLLAGVGMSACFGAVVRAPLTALLIVFEMTHQFDWVPGLMIALVVSQAVARLAGRHNFYDAILVQDGHELIRIKPPTDISAWREMPLDGLALSTPVILPDTRPDTLRSILKRSPYQLFPVREPQGTWRCIERSAIENALRSGAPPNTLPIAVCSEQDSLRQAADGMVQLPRGIALIIDSNSAQPRGILTLHDILRIQSAVTD